MTREEAIAVIRDNIEPIVGGKSLEMAIKALEAQPRWIPVSESIPPFGQDVLVCDLDGDMYITYLHLNGTWGFEYCGNKIKNVVAWQELPLPWKGERDNESCDEIWEKAYAERNGKK